MDRCTLFTRKQTVLHESHSMLYYLVDKERWTNTMIIKVTGEHIRLGRNQRISNTKCPVARAFRAAGFKEIRVGVEHASVEGRGITLPKKVYGFISKKLIGRLAPMEPFSFKLTEKQVKTLRG